MRDKKFAFRLLVIPLLMYSFYLLGWSLEVIAILGIIFTIVILFRGKIWKMTESAVEKYLPFTKAWPDWAQKLLLIIIFYLIYAILKLVIFFTLGLVGIDIEELIMSTYNTNKP